MKSRIARLSLRAALAAPVESETALGGRTVAYAEIGTVWLRLKRGGARQAEGPGPMSLVETATAELRSRGDLAAGMRLSAGSGPAWRVTAVEPDEPRAGRSRLTLERHF